jgi:hypothetical protein
MKIYHLQSNCGGYQKPKGHLDTQMYPECEGTPADRDIVKKIREKREKKKKKNAFVEVEAKKGKKRPANETPYNPWEVCHTVIDNDKDPEKYERCVKHVK